MSHNAPATVLTKNPAQPPKVRARKSGTKPDGKFEIEVNVPDRPKLTLVIWASDEVAAVQKATDLVVRFAKGGAS